MDSFTVSGNVVDLIKRGVFQGTVEVKNGTIAAIHRNSKPLSNQVIMPGFIDAHLHIESSMLIPSEFARLAVTHGTIATVSDPHEIANVLGIEGVRYMLQNGKKVPFHFHFGASPCVPATTFETAGASLTADDIRTLLTIDELKYLSEVMNYPGVLSKDLTLLEKLNIAKELEVPIDGHAPGLRGDDARRYIAAGISTDHECFSLDEALDKLKYGMKILIREGSAAKNFEALHSLIASHPDQVMFCSDDKHPHELVEGHINQLVCRAVNKKGHELFNVLQAACLNPVKHYGLSCGLLQVGDSADFIIVDNLEQFNVESTYIKGVLVAKKGKALISSIPEDEINRFNANLKVPDDFTIRPKGEQIRVIEAFDGELITRGFIDKALIHENNIISDTDRDILKIAVVNRYKDTPPAIGFVRNFGFKKGAIASCIAHDSHNIIATGVSDDEICRAVNAVIKAKGGISVVHENKEEVLPLPVAGLMGLGDGYKIAEKYAALDKQAKLLGSKLSAPFMTLSFMALLVIPSLKLSDKGLFDADAFCFTETSF